MIPLDSLPPLERRILLERNLISQAFSAAPNRYLVLSEDEKLSAMINEEDHLRLVCIHSGLALERGLSPGGEGGRAAGGQRALRRLHGVGFPGHLACPAPARACGPP